MGKPRMHRKMQSKEVQEKPCKPTHSHTHEHRCHFEKRWRLHKQQSLSVIPHLLRQVGLRFFKRLPCCRRRRWRAGCCLLRWWLLLWLHVLRAACGSLRSCLRPHAPRLRHGSTRKTIEKCCKTIAQMKTHWLARATRCSNERLDDVVAGAGQPQGLRRRRRQIVQVGCRYARGLLT